MEQHPREPLWDPWPWSTCFCCIYQEVEPSILKTILQMLTDYGRQFYSLSKTHHPDLNRNDREASDRFVKISEAYAVLGNSTKRERYDHDMRASLGEPPSHAYQGSHSSSGPYGSRPASGLSRRRTQFRGPPPSFYRNGGWGPQSAKDPPTPTPAESSSAPPRPRSAESSAGGKWSNIRLGGSQVDWSNDVPHFDRDRHFWTQEQQELRRMKRVREFSDNNYHRSGGALINFAIVGGVITLAYLISAPFENGKFGSKTKNGL